MSETAKSGTAPPRPLSETQTLECTVEFVLFVRDDGTTVVRAQLAQLPAASSQSAYTQSGEVRPAPGSEPRPAENGALTASGLALAGARPGETLALTGTWTEHPRYGLRFAVTAAERLRPASVRAIQRYLGSGLVRGIGPSWPRRSPSSSASRPWT